MSVPILPGIARRQVLRREVLQCQVLRREVLRREVLRAGLGLAATGTGLTAATALRADPIPADARPETFRPKELVDSGHRFFGTVSRGLALAVEEAGRRWGQPNGYILGQEGSGAIVAGLRYGEGSLYTRNAGNQRVYWQGPSLGFDVGGEGARTMMLIYNLPATRAVFRRFGGIDGSAYFIGGFGFTAMTDGGVVVVPIRSGVGARLGVNVGYLKFTPEATWNPF